MFTNDERTKWKKSNVPISRVIYTVQYFNFVCNKICKKFIKNSNKYLTLQQNLKICKNFTSRVTQKGSNQGKRLGDISKELSLCHKLGISNSYIFATQYRISMNILRLNNLSLKYQMLTPSGCNDIWISKFKNIFFNLIWTYKHEG